MVFSKEMGRRKIKGIESSSKGGISEVRFVYHSKMEGYATLMSDIPKLAKISNSPSLRNGNLNHRTGLTSLNDDTGGKNMCSTAPQPNITPVKRLTSFAQIFIKPSEKLLLSKKISLTMKPSKSNKTEEPKWTKKQEII